MRFKEAVWQANCRSPYYDSKVRVSPKHTKMLINRFPPDPTDHHIFLVFTKKTYFLSFYQKHIFLAGKQSLNKKSEILWHQIYYVYFGKQYQLFCTHSYIHPSIILGPKSHVKCTENSFYR